MGGDVSEGVQNAPSVDVLVVRHMEDEVGEILLKEHVFTKRGEPHSHFNCGCGQ